MEFTLHIPPIACPRPRVTRFGVYYSKRYKDWRKKALKSVTEAMGGNIETNHNLCDVVFEFNVKVPASYSKKDKQAALAGKRLPAADIDNYCKSIQDLLTDACVWYDDTQVGSICAWKQYAEEDSIVIRIKWRE